MYHNELFNNSWLSLSSHHPQTLPPQGSEIDTSPGLWGPQRQRTGRRKLNVDVETLHVERLFYIHHSLQPIIPATCPSFLQASITIQSFSAHFAAFVLFFPSLSSILIHTSSATRFQTTPRGTARHSTDSWVAEGRRCRIIHRILISAIFISRSV